MREACGSSGEADRKEYFSKLMNNASHPMRVGNFHERQTKFDVTKLPSRHVDDDGRDDEETPENAATDDEDDDTDREKHR